MHKCIVCKREMSFTGVCLNCTCDEIENQECYASNIANLILALARKSMLSDNAALMVYPIPIYLINGLVSYKELSLRINEPTVAKWLLSNLCIKLTNITYKNILKVKIPGCKISYVKVKNSYEKEKEFKNRQLFNYTCMFHGSLDENWYGILKHGLNNMSNTSISSNGAVFGKGIYCTYNAQIALNYCKNSQIRIIAAIQPAKNPETYACGIDTYVISDPRDLIIRYLLMIDHYSNL